ncbi:SLC13 family permease [Pleionea sediminis]|uniref:SLC13 family permease n=1 Tax=Pleionea sediminis TaxID=2569479 RepID=UPI001185C6EB|nr:SLC13 family permease [Pleionea sediminis]
MQPYLVLSVVFACFLALLFTRKEPELIFGGGLLSLLLFQVIPVEQALSGFSNPGLITVACLYVVAAGMNESGALKPLIQKITSGVKTVEQGVIKTAAPVALLSSLLNNTPIVAALIPSISSWSKKKGWSNSSFLLPISYAAILGGTCTLVGTSTNLIIYGFIQESEFKNNLGFFDIALIGVPITIVGILYLAIFSKRLLKERRSPRSSLGKTREYCVEMLVSADGPLVGKTLEQAELRNLHGLYLIEIIRGDLVMAAIGPSVSLVANDRLVFTGVVDSISELLEIEGLKLAEQQVFKLSGNTGRARLVEAVIGQHHPLIGKTVKQGQFRKRYNAAIIAVVRNGYRLKMKTGDIVLRPGDTLLMLARRSFVEQFLYSRDFLLVNGLEDLNLDNGEKRPWAWISLFALVSLGVSGLVPVVVAAMCSAAMMLVTGCISLNRAKQSLDLQVLLTIGLAFGLGKALTLSGGAKVIADNVLLVLGNHPIGLLIAVYLMTVVLTEMVTNNAAAVISFSLVSGVVEAMGYNLIPYAIAIMVAASASFISPMGYQTNLMVYSAGGYRMSDYLRLGLPLSILVAVCTLILIPAFWSLN